MPRRVLIVEGHARVRTALAARLALVPQVRVVGAVASVGEAVRLGQAQPPDVVLYDPHTVTRLGTDGVDGATGLRVLTLQGWPVIVLIAVLDAAEAAVLEGSGAVALLRKGRPTRVLLQALETAVRAAPGRTRLADDPERWRALALLDQWQAAAACPGTVAAGDRPAAELAPAGRPVCPEAVACAAR